jgi:hypothetical protein
MKTSWVGRLRQKVVTHTPHPFRSPDFSSPAGPVNDSVFVPATICKQQSTIPKSGSTALEQEFARIADQITLMWGYPELDTFLARLCIDDRGNRKGFPRPVMDELLFLTLLHQQVCTCALVVPNCSKTAAADSPFQFR